MWMPFFLSYLARAHIELGNLEDAWSFIGEAIEVLEQSQERWCEAEVYRMAGEIALMAPEPDTAKAEPYFERALAIARSQQAKSWEIASGDKHGAALAASK
jgi:predicted ATPase